jgi:hypothetical protein
MLLSTIKYEHVHKDLSNLIRSYLCVLLHSRINVDQSNSYIQTSSPHSHGKDHHLEDKIIFITRTEKSTIVTMMLVPLQEWYFFQSTIKQKNKIHVSSEDVSGYFFFSLRCRWKGGGIDGRVIPRTGTSEWIVLSHFTDTRRGCTWCGNTFLLFVLLNLTVGLNRILW